MEFTAGEGATKGKGVHIDKPKSVFFVIFSLRFNRCVISAEDAQPRTFFTHSSTLQLTILPNPLSLWRALPYCQASASSYCSHSSPSPISLSH
jgi:hypothetical protein